MTDLLHHPLVEFTTEHAPLQFINEHGQRVENQHNAEFDQYLAHLSVEDLKSFYRDMMVVRRFDVEATALQRQGELALYAPLLGQEAAQVGSGRALATTDMVFPSYREHGVAHTRGLDMTKILQLFRGVNHGGWIRLSAISTCIPWSLVHMRYMRWAMPWGFSRTQSWPRPVVARGCRTSGPGSCHGVFR